MADWNDVAQALESLLGLTAPPLAITFSAEGAPSGIPPFDEPMPAPTPAGRTGRVPAGCVFWMKAADRAFTTVAEDHANCSVGSLTHGFLSLDEAAGREDVAAMVQAGWVEPAMFPDIPVVETRPETVTYSPLAATTVEPDVVFIRLNGKQLMTLHAATPGMQFEGKPQCHIIPMAVNGQAAASVGCAASRVRTGMAATELTCALPAGDVPAIVDRLRTSAAADAAVARYASEDAARF